MRILIVTDAWYPQVNGVVRTLNATQDALKNFGDEVIMVTPQGRPSIPCPTYPEIRLSLVTARAIKKTFEQHWPCAIHIATEGPLGLAARRFCIKNKLPFTTAFHTQFPEYIQARTRIPAKMTYPLVRWFHKHSTAVMAPTPKVCQNLTKHHFTNVKLWSRGVNTQLFKPGTKAKLGKAKGPILLYVGRVAVEKNIRAFLELNTPGTKVVVGDGPQKTALKKEFPDVLFVGAKHDKELVSYYNAADVFVFPSLTDTFGLVLLEALACGTPVAAYPVNGPIDVITSKKVGALNANLATAITKALKLKRTDCRAFAEQHSWQACSKVFRSYLYNFADHPAYRRYRQKYQARLVK